jgi:hypothetical protein
MLAEILKHSQQDFHPTSPTEMDHGNNAENLTLKS